MVLERPLGVFSCRLALYRIISQSELCVFSIHVLKRSLRWDRFLVVGVGGKDSKIKQPTNAIRHNRCHLRDITIA